MSRPEGPGAAAVGAPVALVAAFLLAAAPIGVLLGCNAVEMAVVAIAGVGFAVVHLTLVVALHLRDLEQVVARRSAGAP